MDTDRNGPRGLAVVALAISASACSSLPPPAPQPAPANYAALAATFLGSIPAKPPLAGALISAVRPAEPPQPGDWTACVKLASGAPYAVFYSNGTVADGRIALPVDRCDAAEGDGPLLAPPKAALPPKPAKKDMKKERAQTPK
jgi:hypothetical protein